MEWFTRNLLVKHRNGECYRDKAYCDRITWWGYLVTPNALLLQSKNPQRVLSEAAWRPHGSLLLCRTLTRGLPEKVQWVNQEPNLNVRSGKVSCDRNYR